MGTHASGVLLKRGLNESTPEACVPLKVIPASVHLK
jgi:hypothetical protein